jgi:hypothetical protein
MGWWMLIGKDVNFKSPKSSNICLFEQTLLLLIEDRALKKGI